MPQTFPPQPTYYDPPSPRSRIDPETPGSISEPSEALAYLTSSSTEPALEGAIRKPSADSISGLDTAFSPSSAPATSSVKGTTHPPEYIHTLHPRRDSMIPLGLNVISPRPPAHFPYNGPSSAQQPFQPNFTMQRAVGFNPTGAVVLPDASPTMNSSVRRASTASTASTLTQSRPVQNLPTTNRERRRSSLTPLHAGLAPPSPSRHMAQGRNSRPSSSEGSSSAGLHSRMRTEPSSKTLGSVARDSYGSAGEFGRRGSMPHLAYPVSSGSSSRTWNPSLSPQRGSMAGEATLEEGFRFGSVSSDTDSPASTALRAIEVPPGASGRRSSLAPDMTRRDVFAEAEAEEAERQRRAFIAATYGVDGKRARERLSIGGASGTPHGSPSNSTRRPSLMLWEKLGAAAAQRAAEAFEVGSSSAPTLPLVNPIASFEDDDILGQRRGSLPIAIPGFLISRKPSRREQKEARLNDIDAPLIIKTDAEESSDDDDELDGGEETNLSPPVRPLPPLLPLSDPGPRLLPSTLALHRASHLLNAKNLQSEPLPHPLPPSLHPPAPVDLAEFDIDFILAGSRAQLGGDKQNKNAPIDATRTQLADVPPTPTLKLGAGGEDEDTFAKFVGEFDDEYGDRRGEWTFRACPAASPTADARDPLDSSAKSPTKIKAEWESQGAGKYELQGNGEIRSVKSGSIWRVRRLGNREYELEEVNKGVQSSPILGGSATSNTVRPAITASGTSYCLIGKAGHKEFGGVKFPYSAAAARLRKQGGSSRQNSTVIPAPQAARLRASISDASGSNSRTVRIGSEDSNTARNLAQSLPLSGAINSMMPKKKRQGSKDATADGDDARGRPSVSFAHKSESSDKDKDKSKKAQERSPSRDRGEKKKSGGLGGVFKRGFASIKHAHGDEKRAAREDKERERMQSQSWSGALLSHRESPAWIHPTGRTGSSQQYFSHPSQRKASASNPPPNLTPSQHSSVDERGTVTPDDQSSEVVITDDDSPSRRDGKGWTGVPDDAVAMVIPIESEGANGPAGIAPFAGSATTENYRQALLVWFVPFNSEGEAERPPITSIASAASSRETSTSSLEGVPSVSQTVPKFQKLLRRRASKEKDGLKLAPAASTANPGPLVRPIPHVSFSTDSSDRTHPLPFRSFRIVARAVDWDDLRCLDRSSPIAYNSSSFDQWAGQNSRAGLLGDRTISSSSSQPSQRPLPNGLHPSWSSTSGPTSPSASVSTAPTSTTGNIMAGRTFPTVIAVCHSRSQGVEFVLEGLDRLGFCQGESAWGPTGYEEWRGSGLSDKGRELLDLLWAGCVAVLGIAQ